MARKKPQAWRPIQDLCEGGNLGSGEEPSPEIQTMENKGTAQAKRNRSTLKKELLCRQVSSSSPLAAGEPRPAGGGKRFGWLRTGGRSVAATRVLTVTHASGIVITMAFTWGPAVGHTQC